MRSRAEAVFLVASLALVLSAGRVAGQTVTGTLSGHVLDASGAVAPSVKITAKNEQTGGVREAATNTEGYYLMSFVPIGSYEVVVAMPGFKTVQKKGVVIELNKNTVSDFTLQPSTLATTVEVRAGETPLIETTVGEYKHSLDAKAIEDTPLPGRNFISLVEQIPGFQNAPWIGSANNPTNSTGSYAAFSGTGSRSATFQIDGVNNDDSSENQNRQNVNVSAIKEFQVLTNAFSAEFGRAGGAVVLVQTKSGTNKLHGDLYDFIQNDIFNANGFFNNRAVPQVPRPLVRRNQYGGTLGGPLFRNKLFFFAAGERVANVGSTSISRFVWLPSDGPRACAPGELARPGRTGEPLGNYCVDPDPAIHPNLQRDLQFMRAVMDLWKTPELEGKTPNDPTSCATLISSGRANRCVRVDRLPLSFPDSDYSGKLDWNTNKKMTMALRYQYSRQRRDSPRIIFGDNFGTVNNRQYNLGYTATRVFSPRQTGEFRYGFGNRNTNQTVTDGDKFPQQFAPLLPIIRFADTGGPSGTVIGTSANVPIIRRQRDHQFVYNHSIMFRRHTLRVGIDQRFLALDDIASATHRGFWRFGTRTVDAAAIQNPIVELSPLRIEGFTGWEQFLLGVVRARTGSTFQKGYGTDLAENRFGDTNLYVQDDFRLRRNLTINLGVRWEAVRAPREIRERFGYGYGGDYANVQPRFGFAWTPDWRNSWLAKLTGGMGNFVIRGGYGISHSRLFQSIFSQSGLNFRAQPPLGFFGDFQNQCINEISDPSCGFVFTPGVATRSGEPACSRTPEGCNGVKLPGGRLATTLLLPDPNLGMPYVQQWNLTVERKLPGKMALQVAYTGNRGIGSLFLQPLNTAQFPITSRAVFVDVGGGNFQPVVFDLVCRDFSDPICVVRDPMTGEILPTASGALRSFAALSNETATLDEKGIVLINGVPHGYISLNASRSTERRPDPTFGRNVAVRNFGWSYYHAMVLKVTKATSRGLSFTGSWTLSKTIDTGSEATFTNVDTNTPTGQRDPARSLRGLSSFDTRHRVVLSYSYELPWMKSQQGVLGRIIGGWNVSGVTSFQSGQPFTITIGSDINLDAEGADRPRISDLSFLFRSVDDGRQTNPCPTAVQPGLPCPDTRSQFQLPGRIFIPAQPPRTTMIPGDQRFLDPGMNGTDTIARNTFFSHGMNNFDMAIWKRFRIREGMNLQVRMEWYNLFNRVMFNAPSARTVISEIPVGRITSQRNPANFVNSAREFGSRMGQLAIRFTF